MMNSHHKDHSLAELLRNAPKESVVALNANETKIVAIGKTLKEAIEKAHEAGENDPVMIWIPKKWTVTIPG